MGNTLWKYKEKDFGGAMAEYKNIPVDPETYEMVKALAKRNWRGLGAQVRVMAEAEAARLTTDGGTDKRMSTDGAEAIPLVKAAQG